MPLRLCTSSWVRELRICSPILASLSVPCFQEVNKKLDVEQLTQDHRAFLRSERERIMQNPNMDILTFGMKGGVVPVSDDFGDGETAENSADPPRVWVRGSSFPGCSYTRSLGDLAAKPWGIIATPDVMHHRLKTEDRRDEFRFCPYPGLGPTN